MIDFSNYLKNPVYCENRKPDFKVFLSFLLFYFVSAFVLGFFIYFLRLAFYLQERTLTFRTPAIRYLYVGFIGPVVEEILFRSWLKVKKGIVVLLLLVIFLLSLKFFLHTKYIPGFIGSAVFLGILLLYFLYGLENINLFVTKHFKILFYGSALAFGLLHATNFTGNPWIILAFSPVLGSPQILLGFLLGYIRMENGLAYSILFHVVINLIALVL